ncbi:hypothetical protein BV25DRAFT_1806709, partial [Artomyces pyxidatus]
SDGGSALRNVQAREGAQKGSGTRGPKNTTLQHWHTPKPTVEPGLGKRWAFKCKYCDQVRTFPRSVDTPTFEDEPKRPPLGNLASHSKKHEDEIRVAAEKGCESEPVTAPIKTGYSLASAELMKGYLEEGALNPALEPTKRGFLRIFAAWLIEEDLPFTTGEAPGLDRLFKYLRIRFELPSDTAVSVILHFLALTMDNAITNDVLARILAKLLMKRYGVPFHPENGQIRCLAHVVNLVVQKILSTALEADDPDIDDYYIRLNKHLPFHYDPESDEDLQALEEAVTAEGKADQETQDDFELAEEDEIEDTNAYSTMSALEKVSHRLARGTINDTLTPLVPRSATSSLPQDC